eukprot:scaffold57706_cov82-Phaeocystis_antarctica.AAC.2
MLPTEPTTPNQGCTRSSVVLGELNSAWLRPSAQGTVDRRRLLAHARSCVTPPLAVGVAVSCNWARVSASPLGTTIVASSWPRYDMRRTSNTGAVWTGAKPSASPRRARNRSLPACSWSASSGSSLAGAGSSRAKILRCRGRVCLPPSWWRRGCSHRTGAAWTHAIRRLDHRRIKKTNWPAGGVRVQRALRVYAKVGPKRIAPAGVGPALELQHHRPHPSQPLETRRRKRRLCPPHALCSVEPQLLRATGSRLCSWHPSKAAAAWICTLSKAVFAQDDVVPIRLPARTCCAPADARVRRRRGRSHRLGSGLAAASCRAPDGQGGGRRRRHASGTLDKAAQALRVAATRVGEVRAIAELLVKRYASTPCPILGANCHGQRRCSAADP